MEYELAKSGFEEAMKIGYYKDPDEEQEKTNKEQEKTDKELLEIRHYKRHPEMLPFVGKSYRGMGKKILLVGESHYIGEADASVGERHFEEVNWYNGFPCADGFKEGNTFFDCFDHYVTRHVVATFINGENGRGYSMFYHPLLAYFGKTNEVKSEFHRFAFMNYFQSPAFARGKSKDPSEEDLEVAKATLKEVIGVLRPDVVVFLSTNAFRAYIGSEKYEDEKTAEHRFLYCKKDGDEPDFYGVVHPTCHWWNRSDGRYGRAAFKHILEEAWGAPQLLPLIERSEP